MIKTDIEKEILELGLEALACMNDLNKPDDPYYIAEIHERARKRIREIEARLNTIDGDIRTAVSPSTIQRLIDLALQKLGQEHMLK